MNKPGLGNVRAEALDALTADQKKQLTTFARLAARGTGEEWSDILHGAFARWLSSEKPVEGPDQTCKFLLQAMRSIRSNHLRHDKVVERYEGQRATKQEDDEDEPLDQAADHAASTEAPLYVQQLYDLCGDQEIKDLLVALADNATPEEIKAEYKWTDNQYEAVRKRKRRLVIRLVHEGKLP